MIVALSMLLLPVATYAITLPLTGKLSRGLRTTYRIGGGLLVILGGGISIYLAGYAGDQGGISAFYFQAAVILVYATFSLVIVLLNRFAGTDVRERKR